MSSKPHRRRRKPQVFKPDLNAYSIQRLSEGVSPLTTHYFGIVGSTNSHALHMRRDGRLFAPAIVLATQQTGGRGRGSHAWWSRRGCITATWVMPVEEQYAPHQLPLIAGLAVRAACIELSGCTDIQLKWPNDVVWQGLKLAGILCERAEGLDLIGIGLNLNVASERIPPDLQEKVGSLSMIAGHNMAITEAVVIVTNHLKRLLLGRTSQPFAAFVHEYRGCDALMGKQISVSVTDGQPAIRGICEGVDREGELLVREGTKLHRLMAGSVTIVGQ